MNHLLEEDSLWSQVFGSGWEMWEWWTGYTFVEGAWDTEGVVVITHQNPEDPDEPATNHRIDPAALEAAYLKVAQKYPHLLDQDIDAGLGDVILQVACFGDVIYG